MNQQDRQHVFFSLVGGAMKQTGIKNALIVHTINDTIAVSVANAENADPEISASFEHLRQYLNEVFAQTTGDKGTPPQLTIIE